MSSSPSIGSVSSAYRGSPVGPVRKSLSTSPAAAASSEASDSVQLSPLARWMQQLDTLPPIRRHLVDVVRAEIEADRYETPQRLDRAVDALADELF